MKKIKVMIDDSSTGTNLSYESEISDSGGKQDILNAVSANGAPYSYIKIMFDDSTFLSGTILGDMRNVGRFEIVGEDGKSLKPEGFSKDDEDYEA